MVGQNKHNDQAQTDLYKSLCLRPVPSSCIYNQECRKFDIMFKIILITLNRTINLVLLECISIIDLFSV